MLSRLNVFRGAVILDDMKLKTPQNNIFKDSYNIKWNLELPGFNSSGNKSENEDEIWKLQIVV